MDAQEFLTEVANRRTEIDSLEERLRRQIGDIAERIRGNLNDANVAKWQDDMSKLQQRLHEEPESGTRSLCDDIARETDAHDVFKHNTEATNRKLKGAEWAEYVLTNITRPAN